MHVGDRPYQPAPVEECGRESSEHARVQRSGSPGEGGTARDSFFSPSLPT